MARKKGGHRRPRSFFICLCCGAKRVFSRSDDSGTYLACDRCNTEYATEFRPVTGAENLVIPAGWIPTDHQLTTWTAIPTDVKDGGRTEAQHCANSWQRRPGNR